VNKGSPFHRRSQYEGTKINNLRAFVFQPTSLLTIYRYRAIFDILRYIAMKEVYMFHRYRGWRGERHHEDEGREERRHGHHGPFHFGGRGHHGPFHFGRRGPFGPPGGLFGGDPFGGEGGGRRRHRRGDIRFALLELIAEQPRHGYDLIKALEERYGGFYRPSPGTVYPTLQLLEDEGSITSEASEGKRVYTITEAGSAVLAEWRARQQGEGRSGRGAHRREMPAELHELRRTTMALAEGVMQVARHGSTAEIQSALKVLENARREVYAILARGEEPE
jgi:DNA-binding PadR family transcriptional regulator